MALACLETVVHLGGPAPLPLNRYLIEIEIPDDAWKVRTQFDVALHVGWDALPAGLVSLDWGTTWAKSEAQLIAQVPSIVVPEDSETMAAPPRIKESDDCRIGIRQPIGHTSPLISRRRPPRLLSQPPCGVAALYI